MTPDPLTFYAWAARPTGPLSDLYMTGEQTEAVYRWLSSILSQAREDERDCDAHGDTIRYRCTHYQQGRKDGYAAALRDAVDNCWGAVAEIPAVELWDGAKAAWWIVKADALAAIEALANVTNPVTIDAPEVK